MKETKEWLNQNQNRLQANLNTQSDNFVNIKNYLSVAKADFQPKFRNLLD